MSISAQEVKALRDKTGAGMMDAKKALVECDGDMEKAIDLLRAKGAAKAAKRDDKEASEGIIGTYMHHSGRVGVMVQLNCETDFVANTDDFKGLAKDIAMHIAASNPVSVSTDSIDPDHIEREKAVYMAQLAEEGKPEAIRAKIVEGKIQKWFKDVALLEQPFVKDPEKTIGTLVTEISARTGEKIEVARFARFSIGG